MLIGNIRTPCDVCNPEATVEADIALEAIVASLATRNMVIGVVAARYHVPTRFTVWPRIACAIGNEKVDFVRHLVLLAVK